MYKVSETFQQTAEDSFVQEAEVEAHTVSDIVAGVKVNSLFWFLEGHLKLVIGPLTYSNIFKVVGIRLCMICSKQRDYNCVTVKYRNQFQGRGRFLPRSVHLALCHS